MSGRQNSGTPWLSTKLGVATCVFVVGLFLLIAKLIAWEITGSNAVLSDALESIINVAAAALSLYTIRLADKPRDYNHPYGHGKAEYLSSGLEGLLIALAGLAVVIKAVYNLFEPASLSRLDLGLIILAGTGVVNLALGLWLRSSAKRERSLILEASGQHLLTDVWTTVGILIGLGLTLATGQYWIDNAVAIIFGLIIVRSGWQVLRKSLGGVMDEADFQTLDELIEVLDRERRDNWIDIHNLRAIRYGDLLHVDAHVTLPWYLSLQEAHDEVEALEKMLESHAEGSFEAFFHVDPCTPVCCQLCPLSTCEHRQHAFREKETWNRENVLSTVKHSVLRQPDAHPSPDD